MNDPLDLYPARPRPAYRQETELYTLMQRKIAASKAMEHICGDKHISEEGFTRAENAEISADRRLLEWFFAEHGITRQMLNEAGFNL